MKISIITIEGERDELSGILRDFDPEEFRVKVNPVKETVKDVLQSIGGGKEMEPMPRVEILPEVIRQLSGKRSRDRICVDCGSEFHDNSQTNTRFSCYKCHPEAKEVHSRDKVCTKCGAKFHDETINNKATKCDICRFPVGNNGKTTGYKPPRIVKPGIGITGKKVCVVCGKDFEPNSNRQLRCSVSCGMKPKSQAEKISQHNKLKAVATAPVKEKRKYTKQPMPVITSAPVETIKPELRHFKPNHHEVNKLPTSRPLIDNTENGEMRKKKPANDRPPIVLRSGDRICKNPKCKKIFRFEKLDQVLCAECEGVKVKEAEMSEV